MKGRLVAAGSAALLLASAACLALACGNGDDSGAPDAIDGSVDASGGGHEEGGTTITPDSGTTSRDATGPASDAAGGIDAAVDAGGPLIAYVGGYGGVIGRYAVDEGTGLLTLQATTTSFGTSPSFLAVNSAVTFLYAVDETNAGRVGAYSIAPATGALTFLASVSSAGEGPPYVGLDRSDAYVFVANYTSGTTTVFPVKADGTLGTATDTRAPGSLAHMMIADPTNHFVFVPCKGSDYVAQFTFDVTSGKLTPNAKAAKLTTAAGAGPRHLAFHPNGEWVYLINETDSTLQALTLDETDGTLSSFQTTSSRSSSVGPSDAAANTGAEVWVHPSGNWLIASNRGDDSLTVFALDPTSGKMTFSGRTPSGGATPRDFAISPAGTFVYAANQNGGDVVPFSFDATSGALAPLAQTVAADAGAISVTMPSFVGFVRLPSL